MIPANLRINADDFGLSLDVSHAVVDAVEEGLVNSVSITAYRDDAVQPLFERLAQRPDVQLGAHLSLTEVPFLTRPRSFPDGTPPADYRALLGVVSRGALGRADVRAEWAAQLDLLASRLGDRAIGHLDGHQHVHMLPGFWGVAAELARARNVPTLRCPYEASRRAWTKDLPLGACLQLLAAVRTGHGRETFFGVGSSMHFRAADYASWAVRVRNEPQRRFELMVHPGRDERGRRELVELRAWVRLLGT